MLQMLIFCPLEKEKKTVFLETAITYIFPCSIFLHLRNLGINVFLPKECKRFTDI